MYSYYWVGMRIMRIKSMGEAKKGLIAGEFREKDLSSPKER